MASSNVKVGEVGTVGFMDVEIAVHKAVSGPDDRRLKQDGWG